MVLFMHSVCHINVRILCFIGPIWGILVLSTHIVIGQTYHIERDVRFF